ncbi:phosphatidylserine decarboxylase proenzyme 1, mitochondrial precursor [Paecilomyces variotii No. 5]|uniref:Phosphatidylserine decarboxylase proenzyme 1, mitochondrial n=1 Tax=Byssochlamys spectabilis (strain No. 5 / NBRC 109023) TaxID=1356009 RepID=V5FEB1_BYSSN|nr:phosphatidylserine decarboxylase proenzyme 1, mitochondrial precursor [Paecilomyces variotii No. 5]
MAMRLSSHAALSYRRAVARRGLAESVLLGGLQYTSARSSFNYRQFSSSRIHNDGQQGDQKDGPKGDSQPDGKESFSSRLRIAWGNTKIEWRPIPIAMGVLFLGLLQFYKMRRVENERQAIQDLEDEENGVVPRRKRIRPSGPWQVQIMSTLPLKALSRLWGQFNELEIPYSLRVPGFKLYSWIFGVNLDEVAEPDLHVYPNLAAFFYRTLKPGVRPIDSDPRAIVSPSDGRVLQFGLIERGEVEQVKGMTYRLEALLGESTPSAVDPNATLDNQEPDPTNVAADEEFARMNGISYTLPTLFSGDKKTKGKKEASLDASTTSKKSTEVEVKEQLDLGDGTPWYSPKPASDTALHYVVIYLAPGDYHRFHSPVSWVVESRRHFAGELYSVSPYLQRTLPGLFTLNERVVLLGRWRWGFFSYTPVGATNVGSIKINFDSELRTNSLTTDTAADRAAALAAKRGERYSGFAEATYRHASKILGGHPLKRGEEMGGFQLGSTIVLVFEAPIGARKSFDVGWTGEREGGWTWTIHQGQRVKVGEKLGYVNI